MILDGCGDGNDGGHDNGHGEGAARDALQEAVDEVLDALKLAALASRGFRTPTASARPPIARIELHDEWITCRTLREVLNHVLGGHGDDDKHLFLFRLERIAKERASQWAASGGTASAHRDSQAALLRRVLCASTSENAALSGDVGLFFQSVARLRAAHNKNAASRERGDCQKEWDVACALGSRLWSAPAEPVGADSRRLHASSAGDVPCAATAPQEALDESPWVLELSAVLHTRRRSSSGCGSG